MAHFWRILRIIVYLAIIWALRGALTGVALAVGSAVAMVVLGLRLRHRVPALDAERLFGAFLTGALAADAVYVLATLLRGDLMSLQSVKLTTGLGAVALIFRAPREFWESAWDRKRSYWT